MVPDSLYLSPTSSRIAPRWQHCFGYLVSPRKKAVMRQVIAGAWWAMDNDCFNGGLDYPLWRARLEEYRPFLTKCLFAVAPDVVGDCSATLAQFPRYAAELRGLGYPVALATQDGLTPADVPWNDIDALFIGGTDAHKLGEEAFYLVLAGRARSKWVHVGRVNSSKRLLHFWRADSWDGTTIGFSPAKSTPIIARAVIEARAKRRGSEMFIAEMPQ